MAQRVLIINADDFGLTRGVNEGILRCAREGVLRSATLMANGNAFGDAVAATRGPQKLGVGVHLVLTDLCAVGESAKLGGLVGDTGRLPRGPSGLLSAIARGWVTREHLLKELTAQVTKVLDNGITPTHFDSHKHVHVFPIVLDAVIEVARRFGVRWVRNPFDATRHVRGLVGKIDPEYRCGFLRQAIEARLVHVFRFYFERSIRRAGLKTPHRFYGTALTGFWTVEAARHVLQSLPLGVSEWMVHPGNFDDALVRSGTRLTASREREKSLLLSKDLRRFFDAQSIILKGFGEDLS